MNKQTLIRAGLAIMALATLALPALAQTPAAPPAAASNQDTTLWGLWMTGGWAMYPILLLSIVSIAFTVYGYLNFRGRIDRDEWVRQARALADGGEAEYIRVFGKKPR